MKKGFCVCLFVTILFLPAQYASAVVFTVNSTVDAVDASIGNGICATSTGACTLRAAIQEANAFAGNDIINLPVGIYRLTIPGPGESAAATGDLDISSNITITGGGSGLASTIQLSGSEEVPVAATTASGTATVTLNLNTGMISGFVTFSGLLGTATAAHIHQAPAGVNGPTILTLSGGVGATSGTWIIAGTLTPAQMSALANNGLYINVHSTVFPGGEVRGQIIAPLNAVTVIDGGGIDRVFDILLLGVLNMSGVTVQNGTATSGGGINSVGSAGLTNCMIRANNAPGGIGGGINNTGSLTMISSIISENAAGAGLGGGINNNGTLTVISSTVRGNFGGLAGGGIGNNGTMSVTNSTVSGNSSASNGGGINNSGTGTLTNVTVSGNLVGAGSGGGIINSGLNALTLTNCTVSNNIAGAGSGISANLSVQMRNTILSNTGGNCSGTFASLGNNLSSDNSCAASLTSATDMNNVNPLLGQLAHSGSSLQTHALLSGSPAIDAGGGCTATDQRGVLRPLDGNGDRIAVCDIGAYEFMKDKIGAFRGGLWPLDYSGNGAWNSTPADSVFTFGLAADVPVSGDWDGDGRAEIGVFRGATWALDFNGNGVWDGGVTDRSFTFGLATDRPVVGDWSGNGITKIGVFRSGLWVLDFNGNGAWNAGVDKVYSFGLPADIPVTGDWNGDGRTKIGVFRGGMWVLDYNGNGVWDGPAVDKLYTFGLAADVPVTGDWSGNGVTKIGVRRGSTWAFDMDGNGIWNAAADKVSTFGLATDKPVTGNW